MPEKGGVAIVENTEIMPKPYGDFHRNGTESYPHPTGEHIKIGKPRYKLRRDLVKDVEGILHRNAPHVAEPCFRAQFAHF